ncbi:unnamed protein product, partial [Brachionus calyciflorus]
ATLLYYSGRDSSAQRFDINRVEIRSKQLIKCHYCHKLGHKVKDCRKKLYEEKNRKEPEVKQVKRGQEFNNKKTITQYNKSRKPENISSVEVEEVETSNIGIVDLDPEVHIRRIRNDLEVIRGETLLGRIEIPTQVIFDTGAKRSVISEEIAKDYDIKSSNTKIKAVVAEKETFRTYLTERTRVIFKRHISEIEFIILPRADVLLGTDWFVANGASINLRKRQVWFESSVYTDSKTSEFDFSEDEMEVMLTDQLDEIEDIESDLDGWDFRPNEKVKFELLSYEENKEASELLESNKELFATSLDDLKEPSNLPPFDIKTTIDTPIRLRPYSVSHHEREIIKKEVDKMLDAGIIQPSTSPWASPVCLTNKPDGSKRFCIDYRHINNIPVQDPFPIPRIEDIIDNLRSGDDFLVNGSQIRVLANFYGNIGHSFNSLYYTGWTL